MVARTARPPVGHRHNHDSHIHGLHDHNGHDAPELLPCARQGVFPCRHVLPQRLQHTSGGTRDVCCGELALGPAVGKAHIGDDGLGRPEVLPRHRVVRAATQLRQHPHRDARQRLHRCDGGPFQHLHTRELSGRGCQIYAVQGVAPARRHHRDRLLGRRYRHSRDVIEQGAGYNAPVRSGRSGAQQLGCAGACAQAQLLAGERTTPGRIAPADGPKPGYSHTRCRTG